jgi:hypothetical protein
MMIMMFCCGSALESQRAGTRAAPNKTKQMARFHARDVRLSTAASMCATSGLLTILA